MPYDDTTHRAILDAHAQAGYAVDDARAGQTTALLHLAQAIERLTVFLGRWYLEANGR